jgi:SAM-dependent methyltransferase
MVNEASKTRRLFGDLEKLILSGNGIDIGCGSDPIFPNVQCFDVQHGDANNITQHVSDQFDFVFSAHCLEHMLNPAHTLKEWWSLVKEGGYMYIVVPDEDLYEQGNWPSKYNSDHKWTFTIYKQKSWSPVSINIIDLIKELSDCSVVRLAVQDNHYDYRLKNRDQTFGLALAQIKFVLQKGSQTSGRAGGLNL